MTLDWVFLLDVDNTLLDNVGIITDLRRHLQQEFGADMESDGLHSQRLLYVSSFLIDYPIEHIGDLNHLDILRCLDAAHP